MLLAIFFRTFCRCTEPHLHWIIFEPKTERNENLPRRLILFLELNYRLKQHVTNSEFVSSLSRLSLSVSTLAQADNSPHSGSALTISPRTKENWETDNCGCWWEASTSALASLIILSAYRVEFEQKFSFTTEMRENRSSIGATFVNK